MKIRFVRIDKETMFSLRTIKDASISTLEVADEDNKLTIEYINARCEQLLKDFTCAYEDRRAAIPQIISELESLKSFILGEKNK